MNAWDPALYQDKHSFVWQYGQDLLSQLAPQKGERILDIGCGTGQLTAQIAATGADVTGVDNSPAMIGEARRNYPVLRFELADVSGMSYDGCFDAIFSNAALHWVRNAEEAASRMAQALRPGGRFVAELGGKGNVRQLIEAVLRALVAFHVPAPEFPWFYPSLGEYASMLERHGLAVSHATLFDRPTRLDGGLGGWIAMFGAKFVELLHGDQREAFVRQVEEYAAPALRRDGVWYADYRRLRIAAVKS